MADSMNPTIMKYKFLIVLLLGLCSNVYSFMYKKNFEHSLPVVMQKSCPDRNSTDSRPCLRGYFEFNAIPGTCPNEYICYRGLWEKCDKDNKGKKRCQKNLTCSCGICQNCENSSCNIDICENTEKRWKFLPTYEMNRLEYAP